MLETLLYIVLPAGVVASCIYYKDKVVNFLKQAKYELVYWALGSLAVGDDILWGWKNKLKGIYELTNLKKQFNCSCIRASKEIR